VLLGRWGSAVSEIAAPSPIDYLSVSLAAGERWTYQPPDAAHGRVDGSQPGKPALPAALQAGELALFDESNAPIDFHAETDVELVVGSAVKHPHDLVLGRLLRAHQCRGVARRRSTDPADRQPPARHRSMTRVSRVRCLHHPGPRQAHAHLPTRTRRFCPPAVATC
jgi:hypothetical protein